MLCRKLFFKPSSSLVLYKNVARSVGLRQQRLLSTSNAWLNNKNEETEDEIEQNPYFEKYADKIKKVKKRG